MIDDDVMPRPTAAAWLPTSGDDRAIVQWIAQRSDSAAYRRRGLFVQQAGDLKQLSVAVQEYGANQTREFAESTRQPRRSRAGIPNRRSPIRARGSGRRTPGARCSRTYTWGVAGWAAATNAIDLSTGEPTAGVSGEIHQALVDLRMAGYNGYSRDREAYFAAQYFSPIDVLLAAGYLYAFVASYLVALGAPGARVGDELRRIYVPPNMRRKVRR